ncbi:hypothetical protein P152DRAFT_38366 [Eremomyces bilateralis CBS 781.70]|uniref:Uncharacterized protein n=1 Tax=Eremomyces bilateralis CBS 781.70 TaxID=1392243 RepID=A0A6G1G1Y7_9PEZI|nr:uncharacterized protein P152DRAFT_38366 [Eremomyces bilateralis CBS 781.70]KAF1811940.1 hypothetical protein P152DRAFT_38366 [Eremomyces bilateralis CBS 781.70]
MPSYPYNEGPPSTAFMITFFGMPSLTILLGLLLLLQPWLSSSRAPKGVPPGSEKVTEHHKSSNQSPVQFLVSGPAAALPSQVDIPAIKFLNKAFAIAQLVSSQPTPRPDGTYAVDHRWHALSSSNNRRIGDLRVELWDSPLDDDAPSLTGKGHPPILTLQMDGSANEKQQPTDLTGLWLVIDFPFASEFQFDRHGFNTFINIIKRRIGERNWTQELRESIAIPLETLNEAREEDWVLIQGKESRGRDLSQVIGIEALEKLKYALGISNPVSLFHVMGE